MIGVDIYLKKKGRKGYRMYQPEGFFFYSLVYSPNAKMYVRYEIQVIINGLMICLKDVDMVFAKHFIIYYYYVNI